MPNRKSKTFANKTKYPLDWPDHISRSKKHESSRFRTSTTQAMKNVEKSLQMLADDSDRSIDNITISSNYTLGNMTPADPGVCVYFRWDGRDLCIPIDRYDKVEDNLQAIHHIIEADRTKLRHGGIEFIMAEKQGSHNLLTDGSEKDWRDILGVDADAGFEQAKKRYRDLVKRHHSDKGGDDHTMAQINKAWDRAKEELT